MGKNPNSKGQTEAADSSDVLPRVLIATIADTTWRMFVPSVGFTLLGVWADKAWGTKPWLMATGIVVGAVAAYVLVARQTARIKGGTK